MKGTVKMKKRTRILSALLCLLMVIGLLPLSLFAAEDNETTEVTAADKSYQTVRETLVNSGFTPYVYVDFEDQTPGLLPQGNFDMSAATPVYDTDGTTVKNYTGGTTKVVSLTSQ